MPRDIDRYQRILLNLRGRLGCEVLSAYLVTVSVPELTSFCSLCGRRFADGERVVRVSCWQREQPKLVCCDFQTCGMKRQQAGAIVGDLCAAVRLPGDQ